MKRKAKHKYIHAYLAEYIEDISREAGINEVEASYLVYLIISSKYNISKKELRSILIQAHKNLNLDGKIKEDEFDPYF
jgi:hypothetical protein